MGKAKTNAPVAASQNVKSSQKASELERKLADRFEATESPKGATTVQVLPSTAPVEAATVAEDALTTNTTVVTSPSAAPTNSSEEETANTPTEKQTSRAPVESSEVAPVSVQTSARSGNEEETPLLDRPLMASAQTNEEQLSKLSSAVARAKNLLDEIRAKVDEYDEKYKASETASAYLSPPIQIARSACDRLASTATTLKDKTVEVPTKAFNQSLAAANGALANISEVANKYDEKLKFSSTLRMAISVPHQKCKEALAEVSRLVSVALAMASAKIQGINQGIRNRAASLANSSAGLVFTVAAGLDSRLAIEDKALTVGSAVAGRAQKIDDRFNVKENLISLASKGLGRAQGLDSKVTGGKIAPMVLSAYETGFSAAATGLLFVQNGYEDAKEQRKPKQATNEKIQQ